MGKVQTATIKSIPASAKPTRSIEIKDYEKPKPEKIKLPNSSGVNTLNTNVYFPSQQLMQNNLNFPYEVQGAPAKPPIYQYNNWITMDGPNPNMEYIFKDYAPERKMDFSGMTLKQRNFLRRVFNRNLTENNAGEFVGVNSSQFRSINRHFRFEGHPTNSNDPRMENPLTSAFGNPWQYLDA